MSRGLPVTLAAALLAGPVACKSERAGQGLALKEGLKAAEEAGRVKPLTAESVDSRDELLAVLGRSYARATRRLGGLGQSLEASFRIESGGEREVTLDEKVVLQIDGEGDYALRHENTYWSREDQDGENGRACWWVDGRFYTARRHGPATAVPVLADEQVRCLESAVEPLVGLIRILGKYLVPTPGETTQVAGRTALRVALAREGLGVELPPPVPRAWPGADAGVQTSPAIWGPRASLVELYTRPKALEGELLLDVETGAVLAGRFDGTLILQKAGRDAELRFQVRLEAAPFDGAITAPEGARQYGPRQRIFEDRRALLGETFKKREPVPLPKPGDAPPLRVGPDEETAAPDEGGAAAPPSDAAGEDAPPGAAPTDPEDAPP